VITQFHTPTYGKLSSKHAMETKQSGPALYIQFFGQNKSRLSAGWDAPLILQQLELILSFPSTLQKQTTFYPHPIQFCQPPISLLDVRLHYKSGAINYQNSRVKYTWPGFKQRLPLNDNTRTLSILQLQTWRFGTNPEHSH
jgi:hypothetical protein